MIVLPNPVRDLYDAQNELRRYYAQTALTFTFDGKLVGDIGEAVVAETFGVKLCDRRMAGIDGYSRDGRSVQIKATGSEGRGPAFTYGEGVADHLIFVRIDFEKGRAVILNNGPEAPVRRLLPKTWAGTETVRLSRILALDATLDVNQRLSWA